MNNVNIIYLTSDCNLACEYCYENLENKEKIVPTKEQLKRDVDIVLEREKEGQVLLCLFGGEPTLEFESIKFITDYTLSKRENVIFNLSSNGWLFQSDSFIKKYKDLKAYKLGRMYLDISFDGVGNFRRKLKNGLDTTPYTIRVLKKLKEEGIRYRIRYTIHKSNIDYVQEDIPKIIETFKPDRVITRINFQELNGNAKLNQINFDDIFKKTGVSVCEFSCKVCKRCTGKDGYTYLQDGIIREKKHDETKELFTDFKEIK